MTSSKPMPSSNQSITPHLVCKNANDAILFYEKAFGATVQVKLSAPNGGLVHASLQIGDSTFMLAEECLEWGSKAPPTLGGSPVTIHLRVEDVDAAIAQAEKAGAVITMPPANMFWGDRYGQVLDPFGHKWSLATPVQTLTVDEVNQAMIKAMNLHS